MGDTFVAGVQYDDWKGTAAADDADLGGIRKLLRDRGMLGDDEFLVGIEIWVGENHGGEVKEPFITALIVKGNTFETVAETLQKSRDPINVRKVNLDDLSIIQFIGLFKRFNVALAWNGLDFAGREYEVSES